MAVMTRADEYSAKVLCPFKPARLTGEEETASLLVIMVTVSGSQTDCVRFAVQNGRSSVQKLATLERWHFPN
jgi:hypothetical protein